MVTGSQGFLGRVLSHQLRPFDVNLVLTGRRSEQGIHLCDLTSITEVSMLVNIFKPDLIINCAAFVPKTSLDYQNKSLTRDSLSIIQNIINTSSCPVINISSMTVYSHPDFVEHPCKESDLLAPNSEYASSKLESESILKTVSRPTLSIRIPGLFGLPKKSGLVYNTLSSCMNSCVPSLPNEPVLWSAMHVYDAASVVASIALNNLFIYPVINCGYQGKININVFLDMVSQILNYPRFGKYVNHPSFEFDLSLLQSLNLLPYRSFKRALSDFAVEIQRI